MQRQSLSTQALLLGAGKAFVAVSGIAVSMVLSRVLTPEAYGTYKQVFLLYAIAAPLFLLGLPASLLYFVPQADSVRRREIVTRTMALLAALGATMAVVLYVLAPVVGQWFDNPGIVAPIRVFALYPPAALVLGAADSIFVAYGQARRAATLSMYFSAATFGATIVPALFGQSVTVIVSWLVMATIVQAIVLITTARSLIGGYRLVYSRDAIREQFSYAMPLAVSGVIGLLAYETDRLIVSSAFSPADYAVYANGAVEIPLVSVMSAAVSAVLIPFIAAAWKEGRRAEIAEVWAEAIRKMGLVLLPVFAFFMVFATDTMVVLFGAIYAESTPIFRVYLLLVPLRVATYGIVLQAVGRTGPILRGAVWYLVGNAVLGLVLVGTLGMIGPAFGTVVATFALAAYLLRNASRFLDMPASRLFPTTRLLKSFGLAVAAVVPVAALLLAPLPSLLRLCTGCVAYAAIFLMSARWLGILTREDQDLLNLWFRKILKLRGNEVA